MKCKIRIFNCITSLLALLMLTGCVQLRKSDNSVHRIFEKQGYTANIYHFDMGNQPIRCIETIGENEQVKPAILFVHGAPGSSKDFHDYLMDSSLIKSARLISMDRPGYGYSGFGKSITSIDEQAKAVLATLDSLEVNTNVILVGHSFGGPVVARASMMYPDRISGLVLLAPAIDPENEKILFIAHFGRIKAFRWLVPKAFKVAADEKFSHVEELKKMEPDWDKISVPVIFIHGERDTLVPYENLNYGKRKLNPFQTEFISIENENHFIPWTQQKLVKDKILDMISIIKLEASN